MFKLNGKTLVVYEDIALVHDVLNTFLSTMTNPGSVTQVLAGNVSSASSDGFDNVAMFACGVSSASLIDIMRILKPGGCFFLMSCRSEEQRTLTRLCLFGGFVECVGPVTSMTCKKPSWSSPVAPEEPLCDTKSKACKNCSCGRKEALEQNVTEDDLKAMLESGEIKSSCGSCYLGDEYRCATCPYRGLPAFEPGEKVTLTL